jgi:glycerate 2-kinase
VFLLKECNFNNVYQNLSAFFTKNQPVKEILPVEIFRIYFTTKHIIKPVELMMILIGLHRMNVTSDRFSDLRKFTSAGAEILEAALASADPQKAVEKTLSSLKKQIDFSGYQKVGLVSIGKAALPMAESVVRSLDTTIKSGIVVSKVVPANANPLLPMMKILRGNHPIPGVESILAAKELIRYIGEFGEQNAILFLISGGASALVTLPAETINLEDIQKLTSLLIACGASIDEINTIRKHLDRVKGGQLAALSSPAVCISLVLSDVLGNRLDVIASGPTVPDPTTFHDALSILKKYDLVASVPEAILSYLKSGVSGIAPETPKANSPIFSRNREIVIGSLEQAMKAAHDRAAALGYKTELLSSLLTGESREAGTSLGAFLRMKARERTAGDPTCCWISGGETTVTLTGNGSGGRNQELALAAVRELDGVAGATLITFATDGEDGRSPAAGAVVTGQTCKKAREKGLDAEVFLANHDSYSYFSEIESAIITGSTGTNVNDLVVMLLD